MVTSAVQRGYLERIEDALEAATDVVKQAAPGTFKVTDNGGREVITDVDHKVNETLRETLSAGDEGWISEIDLHDKARLARRVVWIVDPLDGTREFVDGIPEWCISVGLVIDGIAVAGGITNPSSGESFLGSLDLGVTYNRKRVRTTSRTNLDGAMVLASRQEYARGEWERFEGEQFTIRPTGSVAYKLALVSAGLADATWTLSPKHEWDVAAGVALVNSAGGHVCCVQKAKLQFHQGTNLFPGLMASGKGIYLQISQLLDDLEPGWAL